MTTDRTRLDSIGGREVRVIPKGWQHPRGESGLLVPLLLSNYTFDDDEERTTSTVGRMPDTTQLPTAETEIAAYEAVSEGTPISPAFPNTPAGKLALVNYCAEHRTTFGDHRAGAEAWAAILFGDASISIDGTVRAG